MFERFTERARKVVVYAQEEAHALRHDRLGTPHLLLGLLRDERNVAGRALASLELGIDDVRARVSHFLGPSEGVAIGQIPFTPQAKYALERALTASASLGHGRIGPDHLVLGLLNVSVEQVRTRARRALDKGGDVPLATLPYTLGAEQVLELALEEARGLRHVRMGSEHLVLGLLREQGSLAALLADSLELKVEDVRAMVLRISGPAEPSATEPSPLTPGALRALELAQREARSMHNDHVGSEHILLGLGGALYVDVAQAIENPGAPPPRSPPF